MLDHQIPEPVRQPEGSREEHQTVIKFVLSGPILGGHEPEVAQIVAPSTEVAELAKRVAALERALADGDARIDALSRALAVAVAGVAAAPGNPSSRRSERGAKAPTAEPGALEPTPQPAPAPVAYEPAPAPVAYEPVLAPLVQAAPLAPTPTRPTAQAVAGALLVDPAPWSRPPASANGAAPAKAAVRPDPIALTLVETFEPVPALRPSIPPKVRGLRRMISVLKHL